jgi:hypothetical protein
MRLLTGFSAQAINDSDGIGLLRLKRMYNSLDVRRRLFESLNCSDLRKRERDSPDSGASRQTITRGQLSDGFSYVLVPGSR